MPSRGFSPTVTVATSLDEYGGLPPLCDTMVLARSSIERIRPTPRTTRGLRVRCPRCCRRPLMLELLTACQQFAAALSRRRSTC